MYIPFWKDNLDKKQWWRLSAKTSHDSVAKERLLDASRTGGDSIDAAREKNDSPWLERRQANFFGSIGCLTAFNVLALGATIMLNGSSVRNWSMLDKNACVKATSAYSPVIESMPISYHHEQFNGTLWPGPNPGWSRKEIGDPEAEEIWESFEWIEHFPITQADLVALGKDPETVARFPDEIFELGDNAYIAALDIQHKLHCLNELRKMTFADYGNYAPKKEVHGQLWWIHLRHCVDMLTQDMVCHADADIITYRWMDTQPYPFPDFSSSRQCRSLDDLIRYRDEHKVDVEKYISMEKPRSGINLVPSEPGYYAMYGFGASELYPHGEGYGELPNTTVWFGIPPRDPAK